MYEALADDVFNMTKTIFKFLGLSYHPDVQRFVESHTKSHVGNAYSTFRDTKAAKNHWLQDWANAFDGIGMMQNSCAEAIKLWGYENITQTDLLKFLSPQ